MAQIKENISVRCLDIELAIMREFKFNQNLIVPNISSMMRLLPFETDMLVLTKSNYAHGFEIKTSKSDLKAEFKKPQHTRLNLAFANGLTGLKKYYGKFKYFHYAVPEYLKEDALALIPEFCGLWCIKKWKEGTSIKTKFYQAREPKKLFNRKWSDKERYEVARLGTMRIYKLKQALLNK